MQEQVSDILDNILGLLLLEGSYDIEESDEELRVEVSTPDAGRLIGFKGESLEGFQLLVSLMMLKKNPDTEIKRIILDVEGWRRQKEENLTEQAKIWADQVLSSGVEMELEPMSPWQRRIIHLALQDLKGISAESIGEGKDRHLVIKSIK